MTTKNEQVSVTVEITKRGHKLLNFYEVLCEKLDGEVITSISFLSKERAQETADHYNEYLTDLYRHCWVSENFLFV